MNEKRVITKWGTDGDLAVIYRVGDLLLFYDVENDPKFECDEMISAERADATRPYKATMFSWENVPIDAYMKIIW